jgi:alkylation response protein AidB-like acyl-CoA dehydrogenase
MDFAPDESEQRFRDEVRAFIADHLPAQIARRVKRGYHQHPEEMRLWTAALHKKGWSAPSWPIEYGGPGWSPAQRLVFEVETFRAGAPALSTLGVSLVGPVIYTFGSAAQKARYLPGILSGDEFWGQGFSEPGAGSDLASLRTRATRDGDFYVINGHKAWSSEAHWAQHIFLLARTNPDVKPQAGISFLLVPADAPGLAITPVVDIGGGKSVLNEMFFDGVRIPVTNLVGQEGMGWSYAKFLLERERAFSAEVPRNRKNFERLRKIASVEMKRGRPVIEDEPFALRMAQIQVDLDTLEYLTLSALYASESNTGIGCLASVLKIRGTELIQKIGELTMEALGDRAAEFYSEPSDGESTLAEIDHAYGVAAEFFYRRAVTIYGGSNEIQRNLIAKKGLGL